VEASSRDADVGGQLAGISRAVVSIHAEHYGRGPDRAKTIWQRDVILCLLEEVYTPAERTLIRAGRFDQVRSLRTAFQDEVEPLLRAAVEAVTGRRVRAFLSQVNADPELASEVFVLEPLEQAETFSEEP
jgi:uncharacterized protein YbcI